MENVVEQLRKMGREANARRVMMSPNMAKLCLAAGHDHDRPISKDRVSRYRDDIRNNRWKYTGAAIVFTRSGVRVDGQHRLVAILEEGRAVEVLVVFDADEDAWLYTDQGRGRSAGDMLPSDTKNRVLIAAALSWLHREEAGVLHLSGGSGGLRAPDAPAVLARYPGLEESCRTVTTMRGTRAPTSLLAYSHYRASSYNTTMASEFFARLDSGESLTTESSVYLLRERLLKNASSKAKLDRIELLALIIKSWTYYVSDRRVRSLSWHGIPTRAVDGSIVRSPEPFPSWPGGSLRRSA